jgi:hypothetical protein
MMSCTRRLFLQQSLSAGVAAALWNAPALAQYATLQSVGYLSRKLDVTAAQYRDWYIKHHAVDFLSFAKPHMMRYTQDFVDRAHLGDVDFDVISQFGWRSADARAKALKFMGSPEGRAVMAKHPSPGNKPGPNEDHSGARTYSIDERLIAGPARGYDEPNTKKHLALLRRKDAAPGAFQVAVNNYAGNIFKKAKGDALRVIINFAVPETGRPAPFHDAIVMVWPKEGINLAGLMKTAEPGIEIDNILDVSEVEADLS